MNTLLKFLYLFQCVPIFLPQIFFRRINTIISEFIWSKKIPRIRKQFLQRPKALGGMVLPNLRFYYWAVHLRIIQSWLQSDSHHSMPVWLKLEADSCHAVSLAALVHSPIKSPSSSYTKNVIVKIQALFRSSDLFNIGSNNSKLCLSPIFGRWCICNFV